jgi:hypothetical protein
MIDHDVIGFRPAAGHTIPLAPLALFSDPSGRMHQSWEAQIEHGQGQDAFRFDSAQRQFVADARGDGLPEMAVFLPQGQEHADIMNACLLRIGTSDMDGLVRQLGHGVSLADLDGYGGEFVLPPNNRLPVEGNLLVPATDSREFAQLLRGLERLQLEAEPRIWPLFSELGTKGTGVVVTGFVAARVVRVVAPSEEEPLLITLQPCVFAVPSAVTDWAHNGSDSKPAANAYLCKVRLVE